MKRREFIASTAGLIGAGLPLGLRAEDKPCPPTALQVGGGTSVSTVCQPASQTPAWLKGKPLYEWFEIPGTSVSSVEPRVDSLQRGGTGPRSKIEAWCGAALRSKGSVYLIGACGGHGDYAGNEVDAIQLGVDTPSWKELRGPSASGVLINHSECYLDKRRSATHTYYCQQYCDATDSLIMMPSPGMWSSALPDPPGDWPYVGTRPMAFSFVANDWLPPEKYDAIAFAKSSDWIALLAATDRATGDIYYARAGDGRLWRFSPTSGKTITIGGYDHSNYAGAAIDPIRQRMLVVGDYSGTVGPRVVQLDKAEKLPVKFSGLGAGALSMGGYPGVVFDESADRFLVFKNANPIVTYSVDAETFDVSILPVAKAPPARLGGILNSIQYAPELKGVVVATSYFGNMHFMRLA